MSDRRTLYVSRSLHDTGPLLAWAREQRLTKLIAADDLHVTIAYSRKAVDWDALEVDKADLTVTGGLRSVEVLGEGAVVLRFESKALLDRWQALCDAGAAWDWPSYKPHATLTYEAGDVDLAKVEPFGGPLTFGPEVFAEVKDDWEPKVASDAALVLKPMKQDAIALDRASVRAVDQDGHLHVSRTPISKANVCPYWGREIPDWQALGLKADKTYQLYRDPAELEKAAASFNGKPLLFGHKAVTADDHDHDMTVGSVTGAEWQAPYLYAALDVWSGPAIKEIQSGRQEQLSSAYRYKADMTPGMAPDGTRYDGRMTAISANHVALVSAGRAGPDVVVLDSKPLNLKDAFMATKAAVPSRTAAMAQGALMMLAKPKLAQDAKLDLSPLFKGVNAKNMKAKAPEIAAAFGKAMRPKMAADADLDQAEVQAVVEQIAEIIDAESDTIAEAVAEPMTPTADDDDTQLRAMLKAKGYGDAEIDAICSKEVVAADDVEKDAEAIKTAQDAAVKDATKDMVSKTAMDAAISAAVKLATDAATKTQRDIREAEAAVRPVVGELAMAHDSADGVYRTALKVLKIEGADTLPAEALRPVFSIVATKKAEPSPRPAHLAQDAAASKDYDSRFGANATRLKN